MAARGPPVRRRGCELRRHHDGEPAESRFGFAVDGDRVSQPAPDRLVVDRTAGRSGTPGTPAAPGSTRMRPSASRTPRLPLRSVRRRSQPPEPVSARRPGLRCPAQSGSTAPGSFLPVWTSGSSAASQPTPRRPCHARPRSPCTRHQPGRAPGPRRTAPPPRRNRDIRPSTREASRAIGRARCAGSSLPETSPTSASASPPAVVQAYRTARWASPRRTTRLEPGQRAVDHRAHRAVVAERRNAADRVAGELPDLAAAPSARRRRAGQPDPAVAGAQAQHGSSPSIRTTDLTICPSSQPTASAASTAVRVDSDSSRTSTSRPRRLRAVAEPQGRGVHLGQ